MCPASLNTVLSTSRAAVQRIPLYHSRTPPKKNPRHSAIYPPVLMIHGVLASESTYRSIIKRPDFVPYREVIGVDLRNHGRSPHVSIEEGMRYEDMAGDVLQLMDTERIEKMCVIGHSMGGKVAMQVALSEPQRVSELVVVDIAPLNYTVGKDSNDPYIATKAMTKIDFSNIQRRSEVDAQLLKHGVKSEAVRQFVMTNLASEEEQSKRTYRWKLNLAAVHAAFPNIMSFPDHTGRVYNGPTCVIRGGKSKYVPFEAMKRFTSLFPRSKLVTISEAGHWLQAQAPDDFVASVNDFLGDERSMQES